MFGNFDKNTKEVLLTLLVIVCIVLIVNVIGVSIIPFLVGMLMFIVIRREIKDQGFFEKDEK